MKKIGSIVSVPWSEYSWIGTILRRRGVPDLIGRITRIDGAYHYVKVLNNPKYRMLELYDNEFQVIG